METFETGLVLGGFCGERVYVTKLGGVINGRCTLLLGLRSNSQSLDHLALAFRELWRMSWWLREAICLTSSA